MTTTTANQGLTLPAGTDANNIPGTFDDYNDGVENRLVQRYLSSADRTVRNPLPNAGELSYLSSTDNLERYNGSSWTPMPGQVIARGSRSSTSSASTGTEVAVLRIDNIQVLAGRAYVIRVNNFVIDSTIVNDGFNARLRYDNTGAVATTISSELTALRLTVTSTAQSPILPINANYYAASDETLSILLSIQRTSGTGSVTIRPTSGQTIDIVVQDAGTDPGDTGVDL